MTSHLMQGGVYETLPAEIYTNPDVFKDEWHRVFRRSWQLAGHLTDIANLGDYFVAEFSGTSIIVMRGQDNEIRAFYNVCIHRGHELLAGAGCVKKMTCPYHAWTYDTAGQLRAAPNAKNFPDFDVSKYSLNQVQLEVFHGLILINLDKTAPSFLGTVQSVSSEIAEYAPSLDIYVRADRTERLSAANWKIVAENFNECYHCAIVHKTLTTGVVDPEQYLTRPADYGIRHESPARVGDVQSYGYVADTDAKTDKFLTWWFWPLFAIQIYPGGIVNTYRWHPISVDQTKVEVDWWLPNKTPSSVEAEIIHQHRTTTFAEDGPIVDSVQRGLASGGYDVGPVVVDQTCSSMSEHPILTFQNHYKKSMLDPADLAG